MCNKIECAVLVISPVTLVLFWESESWYGVKYGSMFLIFFVVILKGFQCVGNRRDWDHRDPRESDISMENDLMDLRRNVYKYGLGGRRRITEYLSYCIPFIQKGKKWEKIPVIWQYKKSKKWERADEKGYYYYNCGKWPSPLASMLRDQERIAQFDYYRCFEKKIQRNLVVYIADQRLDDTFMSRVVHRGILEAEYDIIVPFFAPFGTGRQSATQADHGESFQTVVDGPITSNSSILEIRELLKYFGDVIGYSNIMLVGIAQGGWMAMRAAQILLRFKRNVNVGLVLVVPYHTCTPFSELLRGSIKENFGIDSGQSTMTNDEFSSKNYPQFCKTIQGWENMPFRKMEELEEKDPECKKLRMNQIRLITAMHASCDSVLSKEQKFEVFVEIRALARKNKSKLEITGMDCGHFGIFKNEKIQNMVSLKICEGIRFLNSTQHNLKVKKEKNM